ncbi:hypothetical protein Syn7502_03654 (plasmid) [Synechococcus sp. PCC 7502]|uniref:hypothetical protein n=1 Tax=Synechococcus sp. PCC 7502 TaxID=1173263 RepID=UPI00029F9422|nr:hypothetical protein [Synechococcus sp. PCC 7502]AFY75477.1 hypothetical protein Syn7502_03654 [Synechococcus sp. PCC 7502]
MNNEKISSTNQTDSNPDPITGESGAHPLGTGVGAAGAGATATVIGGVVGGPIGAVVGAVVGSVVGGLAGKSTAEQINPTVEDTHWRASYSSRPYVEKGAVYEDYQPAYRIGYEGYARYGKSGQSFHDVESDLHRDYDANKTGSLSWEQAKHAVKDAWDRAATSVPSR